MIRTIRDRFAPSQKLQLKVILFMPFVLEGCSAVVFKGINNMVDGEMPGVTFLGYRR